MDLSKERRAITGAFYTPSQWVSEAHKILEKHFDLENYYIWDCASGEGNLLIGLGNKENIYASTLEERDIEILKENLNLPEGHIFQFDFLNSLFSELPESLKEIIHNPEKRKHLIILINPPYGESQNRFHDRELGLAKKNMHKSIIFEKYGSKSFLRELYVQFLFRIYFEIPDAFIAIFSTEKYLVSKNFENFRNDFRAELLDGFIVDSKSFSNVKSNFPISFCLWDTSKKEVFKEKRFPIYDSKKGKVSEKILRSPDSRRTLKDMMYSNSDSSDEPLMYCVIKGCDIKNSLKYTYITNIIKTKETAHTPITRNNFLEMIFGCGIRKSLKITKYNEKSIIFCDDDRWKDDMEFFSDCIVLCAFDNIIRETTHNNLIPFYESEMNLESSLGSHFLQDYIHGKIVYYDLFSKKCSNFKETEESRRVLKIGKSLFSYYHSFEGTKTDAGIYEVKEFFKGRDKNGRMNLTSKDKKAQGYFDELRKAIKDLKENILQKAITYKFLNEDDLK